MDDKKKSAQSSDLITRRQMVHYGLAGMAGIAGGFWPLSALGEAIFVDQIPDTLKEKYITSAHEYIQRTKQWKLYEYKLTLQYIEQKKQVAVFNAIHLQGIFENRQQIAKDGGVKKIGIHPLEFSILVDIVDLTVQENTPDAKFLHEIKE